MTTLDEQIDACDEDPGITCVVLEAEPWEPGPGGMERRAGLALFVLAGDHALKVVVFGSPGGGVSLHVDAFTDGEPHDEITPRVDELFGGVMISHP